MGRRKAKSSKRSASSVEAAATAAAAAIGHGDGGGGGGYSYDSREEEEGSNAVTLGSSSSSNSSKKVRRISSSSSSSSHNSGSGSSSRIRRSNAVTTSKIEHHVGRQHQRQSLRTSVVDNDAVVAATTPTTIAADGDSRQRGGDFSTTTTTATPSAPSAAASDATYVRTTTTTTTPTTTVTTTTTPTTTVTTTTTNPTTSSSCTHMVMRSAYDVTSSAAAIPGRACWFDAGNKSCWAVFAPDDALILRGACFASVWAGAARLSACTVKAGGDAAAGAAWGPSPRHRLVYPTNGLSGYLRIEGLDHATVAGPAPTAAAVTTTATSASVRARPLAPTPTGLVSPHAQWARMAAIKGVRLADLSLVLLEPCRPWEMDSVIRSCFPRLLSTSTSLQKTDAAKGGTTTAVGAATAAAAVVVPFTVSSARDGNSDNGESQSDYTTAATTATTTATATTARAATTTTATTASATANDISSRAQKSQLQSPVSGSLHSAAVLPPTISEAPLSSSDGSGVSVSTAWETKAEAFASMVHPDNMADIFGLETNQQEPAVVVLGPKDAGKSTFCRHLVSRLLVDHTHVAYLDCDPGQSELTPPGLVSLHVLSTPIFGPSWTQLRRPIEARFIGDNSPKAAPYVYLKAVRALVRAYRAHAASRGGVLPLVVNTMGWIKGLGLPLLMDTIRAVCPAAVVDVRASANQARNLNLFPQQGQANSGDGDGGGDGGGDHECCQRGFAALLTDPSLKLEAAVAAYTTPHSEQQQQQQQPEPVRDLDDTSATTTTTTTAAAAVACGSDGYHDDVGKGVAAIAVGCTCPPVYWTIPAARQGSTPAANAATTAAENRLATLAAYFMSSRPQLPFLAQPTLSARLSSLSIAFVGAQIPLREALIAINGTLVGLCHTLTKTKTNATPASSASKRTVVQAFAYGCQASPALTSSQPSTATTTATATAAATVVAGSPRVLCAPPSGTRCLGLAIVRGIDRAADCIYLLTPEPLDVVSHVNCLLRGGMMLPPRLVAGQASGGLGRHGGATPYQTADFSTSSVLGRGARKTRTNLERYSLTHGAGR